MAKLSLISLNVLLVFALKIFFGGDVTVVQKMQPNIKPGETLMVELEITKGDRGGFAKWQQKLPQGFIASSVDTDGATFSFKNQEIKVIWMALPEKETFSIKYKIETSTETGGDYNLAGKFSYIEENERKDVSSEIFILSIGDEAVAVKDDEEEIEEPSFGDDLFDGGGEEVVTETKNQAQKEEVITDEQSLDETVAEKVEAEQPTKTSTTAVTTQAAQDETVTITRTVEHINEGNYVVTLNLSKGDLNSFGKVEDYLPPNYIASENTSSQGIFSFKGNVVKVLWMTLPADENIEIKYNLESTSDELETAQIHGVFSYLNVDESNQTKLAPTTFKNYLAVEQLANEEDDKPEADHTPEDSANQLISDNNNSDNLTEEVTNKNTKSEEELVADITNIPSPETAVSYKVQIAAAKKEVTQRYFIDRHNISEAVSIEYHETWYKYTVGGYNVYKAARDKRNDIWATNNKINDAFVTAYNAGERISVQEALMISKQKWFK